MNKLQTSYLGLGAILIFAMSAVDAQANTIYQNDFSGGSTANFTLPAYSAIVSLPTDSGGLASVNQAKWLEINSLAPKTVDETVTLALSGLTAGQQYTVGFNLFIGASWDGSAGYYGADEWKLTATGNAAPVQTLVDATFANGQAGINFGADSRQSYSDGNPVAGTGLLYNRFEGADASFSLNQGGNYGSDYSIYSFSQGAGNPVLTFTATGDTANLVFQRLGIPSGDSADEYWAIGNINVVSSVPEPETNALLFAGLAIIGLTTRKRHSL